MTGIVWFADAELPVGQIEIAVDEVISQAVFIEEILVAVEDDQWFPLSLFDRHCRELRLAPCRVRFAAAMSSAEIAGKVLIAAEKTTIRRNSSSHRFEAGCFWRVVHDGWLLCSHDFVLAAIAAFRFIEQRGIVASQ